MHVCQLGLQLGYLRFEKGDSVLTLTRGAAQWSAQPRRAACQPRGERPRRNEPTGKLCTEEKQEGLDHSTSWVLCSRYYGS
jgi:hypothetical protein